jgi:hypothetical protein
MDQGNPQSSEATKVSEGKSRRSRRNGYSFLCFFVSHLISVSQAKVFCLTMLRIGKNSKEGLWRLGKNLREEVEGKERSQKLRERKSLRTKEGIRQWWRYRGKPLPSSALPRKRKERKSVCLTELFVSLHLTTLRLVLNLILSMDQPLSTFSRTHVHPSQVIFLYLPMNRDIRGKPKCLSSFSHPNFFVFRFFIFICHKLG